MPGNSLESEFRIQESGVSSQNKPGFQFEFHSEFQILNSKF